MPFFDQHWQLRAALAVVVGASAVAFPPRYLALAVPLDRRLGLAPWLDVLFAIGAGIVLALMALAVALGVWRARQRLEWRAAAIAAGDARSARHEETRSHEAESDLDESFVVTWRIEAIDRILSAGLGLFFVVGGGSLALFFVAFFAYVFVGGHTESFHASGLRLWGLVVMTMITAPFGLPLVGALVDLRGSLVNRSPRVIVDADGIEVHDRAGRVQQLRWSEVRLFERTGDGGYALYGHGGWVYWYGLPRDAEPFGGDTHLLAIISHHTGLRPARLVQPLLPWRPERVMH